MNQTLEIPSESLDSVYKKRVLIFRIIMLSYWLVELIGITLYFVSYAILGLHPNKIKHLYKVVERKEVWINCDLSTNSLQKPESVLFIYKVVWLRQGF